MQVELAPPAAAVAALNMSVVIPTYNRAHLMIRALQSVLQQTHSPAEIIVVDDGSEDDTQDRVAAFGDRVQYVRQENAGAAAARHRGMQTAVSDWVAFLDSDDYWAPTHLARMAAAITATKGHGRFYFADTLVHTPDGDCSYWQKRGFAITGAHQLLTDATEWVMMRGQPMLLQASVFNRDAYFAGGGFWTPLRNREDTHLFLKLGLGGPACAVAGVGTHMTADDAPQNRLTQTLDAARGYRYQVMMFSDLLQRPLTPPVQRELRRRLADAYLSLARTAARQKAWGTAVAHLWRAVRTDVRLPLGIVAQKMTGAKDARG